MPSTKLAFIRYMLIDRMLRNRQKKYPTKEEIFEACKEQFGIVSASTVEKDLLAMRVEFDAPIKYDKKQNGYYYEDPSFKLFSVNLTNEQLVALQFVESFLEGFKALPIFNEFSDAVDKVLDGLQITRKFNQSTVDLSNFIRIDKSAYFKGSEVLSSLITAIAEQKVIYLQYRKFGSDITKSYTVHPYLLKEFRHLWYLTGYVPESEEEKIRIFAVDRIVEFSVSAAPLIPAEQTGFNAEVFFKHCYGITALRQQPERIVLAFSADQGNYLKINPIHPSLEFLEDNDQVCKVQLFLVNNFEIRNWIMGFGRKVEVLEPASLREQIAEEMRAAASHYA